jgi:uncharacterized damage-inducible protein DinB
MQTSDHLVELVNYNEWANARIAESLKTANIERGQQILSHIVTTEQEYLERLKGKDSTGFNFWPERSIEECESLNQTNSDRFRKELNHGETGLDKVINYKNSRGEPNSNTLRELITHVLIHSAIHRGNIIIKLREAGFEPPQTDNLIYLRETKLK